VYQIYEFIFKGRIIIIIITIVILEKSIQHFLLIYFLCPRQNYGE